MRDQMDNLRFDRSFRTPSSEGYHVMLGTERIATADLHFTAADVRCTLVMEKNMEREEIAHVIERIDEDLVLSADVPRDDFLVTVFQGSEFGFFSDEFHADQDEVVIGEEDSEDDDDFSDDEEPGRN
jgi:hypothetical protein